MENLTTLFAHCAYAYILAVYQLGSVGDFIIRLAKLKTCFACVWVRLCTCRGLYVYVWCVWCITSCVYHVLCVSVGYMLYVLCMCVLCAFGLTLHTCQDPSQKNNIPGSHSRPECSEHITETEWRAC